ncbi:hypothetical protein [Streptomyces sp. NPDC059552]
MSDMTSASRSIDPYFEQTRLQMLAEIGSARDSPEHPLAADRAQAT